MTNERQTVSASATLGQAFDDYVKTLKQNENYEGYVRRYVEHVGTDTLLSSLTGSRVESYAEQQIRSSDPKAPERVESLKHWFQFLKKRGYVESNFGVNIRVRRTGRTSGASAVRIEEKPIEMTAEGLETLRSELEKLTSQRSDLVQAVATAREDKDFRENAPLEAAREALAFADQRQKQIETTIKRAVVVSGKGGNVSAVGSTVKVVRLDDGKNEAREFVLVSPREANAKENKISVESPVGKQLLGRTVSEEVHVTLPNSSVHRYRIDEIRHSS